MLRAENISVHIGSAWLLQQIDVTFHPGKINLVIGPNGAGKSTLVRTLSGQLHPNEGKVLLDDQPIRSMPLRELARRRAVLSQHVEIPFPLKAREVVMMGRHPHFVGRPGPHDEKAVDEAMDMFDVSGFADRQYQTLSGGEKQRVNFARVLSQIWFPGSASRYLLLDEPLTFLDVHFQFQFMRQLSALLSQRDLILVGVVHDLNLAARFADHLILLHAGKVLAQGPREFVLTRENIKTAFQLDPHIHYERDQGIMYLVFH